MSRRTRGFRHDPCAFAPATLILAAVSGPVHADLAAAALAQNCYTCHGPGARGAAPIPGIAGKSRAWLEDRLRALRSDPEATIMNRIARGYSDAEIRTIARFLSEGR
jgi:sulfide dehydrogenase cytochrome subunit